MKQCTNCQKAKELTDFYAIKNRPGKFRSQCKDCDRSKSRARMNNPTYYAKRLEKLRGYRAECAAVEKPEEGTQCCYSCHKEKHLSEFHKDKGVPNGRNTRCKKCISEMSKSGYYANRWGLDADVIREKMEAQYGKCKICGKTAKLVLDHNHETDVIRDFLCNHCNSGLGYLMDSPTIIAKALKYLEDHGLKPSHLKADPKLKYRRKWET